jgi:GTP1/Obg family GTP-binding protein
MKELKDAAEEAIKLIEKVGKDLPGHIEKMKDLKKEEVELMDAALLRFEDVMKEANEKINELNNIFKR